jgi:hypothetical protein
MNSFIYLILLFGLQSAQAATVCSNLILETPEGRPLLKSYEKELKKAKSNSGRWLN